MCLYLRFRSYVLWFLTDKSKAFPSHLNTFITNKENELHNSFEVPEAHWRGEEEVFGCV